MLTKVRPKLGFLGLMQGLYDKSQPEIPAYEEKFIHALLEKLSDVADIDFPGIAKDKSYIDKYVKYFNDQDYDGILYVNLLYSPGMRIIQAFEHNDLPVLIANIQPLPSVHDKWDWSLLTTNQGIHGAQDSANMLMRVGANRTIITEDWQSERFHDYVEDWAMAAATAKAIRKTSACVFNKMYGMGDILGDEIAFCKKFGMFIKYDSVGLIVEKMDEVTEAEIDEVIKENEERYEIDPKITEEQHRYAARLQLAFQKYMDENGFDAFSPNFTIYYDDGKRIRQLPIMGASNLMAKGYGYSAEGDVHCMLLMCLGHLLIGDPGFTEMYSLDYERDACLMAHMGEGNPAIARKDRPVKLIDRFLDIGDMENPPTPVFSAEPGVCTMASLVAVSGDQYRMVVARGVNLDDKEIPGIPMPYTFFRPDSGIRAAMDKWLEYGGTHHEVMFLGDHVQRLKMLCHIMDIEFVEV